MNERGGPFIPAILDDLGLPPAAFRVACRIARRGRCTESVKSMAEGCRLLRKTVKESIEGLIACGVVELVGKKGRGNVYRIAPVSLWRRWDSGPPMEFGPRTQAWIKRWQRRFSQTVNQS